MSTILNTNGAELQIPSLLPEVTGKFYVITADWNPLITYALRDGAIEVLKKAGVAKDNIVSLAVPGTVELVNAAAVAMKKGPVSKFTKDGELIDGKPVEAVIVIGCVIRGDTPHFDYVCQIAAQGVAELNAKGEAPVIFGVLTVDNQQQAFDRAGGILGNKGAEAACAAITMANFPHLV